MAGTLRQKLGLTWRLHGDGRHIRPGEVVLPEERLRWPLTIGVGVQHVMAMFGATVLVPTLTGFPATTALFFSAVGTVLFLLLTAGRVPSYLATWDPPLPSSHPLPPPPRPITCMPPWAGYSSPGSPYS